MNDKTRCNSLPLYQPADQSNEMNCEGIDIHGVVLAAGSSDRFGDRNKLLENFDGSPLVCHPVATLKAAEVSAVSVVVGHQSEKLREAIADLDVEVIQNNDFAGGQSTSLRVGLTRVQQQEPDAVVIGLADMPEVSTESINRLLTAYCQGQGDALAAAYNGIRGNPVLFDKAYFEALVSIVGDKGGKEVLFEADQPALIETDDPGVLNDIDHPKDINE